MLRLEDRQMQTLQWPLILTNPDLPLEKPVNKFCNRSFIINRLEKKWLWRYSYYSKLPDQNNLLWAGKYDDKCSQPSRNHDGHSKKVSQSPQVNLSVTKAHYLSRSSCFCYTTFSTLSKSFLLYFIYRQTGRLREKTAQ